MVRRREHDDMLISRMLNDTFIEVSLHDNEPIRELNSYFEDRLDHGDDFTDAMEQEGLYPLVESDHRLLLEFLTAAGVTFSLGLYCPNGGFYHLVFEGTPLDLPHNWSFLDIAHGCFGLHLDSINDHDSLLPALSAIDPEISDVIFIGCEDKELLMIALKEQQKPIANVIRSYFTNGEVVFGGSITTPSQKVA